MSEPTNAPRVWLRWALASALVCGTVVGSIAACARARGSGGSPACRDLTGRGSRPASRCGGGRAGGSRPSHRGAIPSGPAAAPWTKETLPRRHRPMPTLRHKPTQMRQLPPRMRRMPPHSIRPPGDAPPLTRQPLKRPRPSKRKPTPAAAAEAATAALPSYQHPMTPGKCQSALDSRRRRKRLALLPAGQPAESSRRRAG